jgi:hypothetical protein
VEDLEISVAVTTADGLPAAGARDQATAALLTLYRHPVPLNIHLFTEFLMGVLAGQRLRYKAVALDASLRKSRLPGLL